MRATVRRRFGSPPGTAAPISAFQKSLKPARPARSLNVRAEIRGGPPQRTRQPVRAAPAMEDDIRERLAAQQYREAFELLVERFKDKVFRLAFSMLRDPAAAEDMAQDIFLKVWKALPGYHGAASVSTWLYTIARNTCLTELKRRAARPTVSLQAPELEGAVDAIPAMQTSDPESGAGMDTHAMLDRLPDKYRRVVTLFYLEQKSYEEVSAMLGLPLGTVKTFLFRAKKELLRIASRRPMTAALA